MQSYAIFFVGAGAIGLPAILLCLWLAAVQGQGAKPPDGWRCSRGREADREGRPQARPGR